LHSYITASATADRGSTSANVEWYGWVPDLPDARDYIFSAPAALLAALPKRADVISGCPPVYNQGRLGSCTANAIAAAVEFDLIKQRAGRVFIPSRLFLYYNERLMWGTVNTDSGAPIRDGIKCIARQGDCPEQLWPYVIKRFAEKPPPSCYAKALKYRAVEYKRLKRGLDDFRGCIASGYPFVFGFTAYDSFEGKEVARTGHLGLPSAGEGVVGGHAVLCVGYDDSRRWFVVRNSWGRDWGNRGYFTMPYDYLMNGNLSDDFWTIRLVS
jgi:C1A family cysteine protease